jgi:hypothetical protein
MQIATYDRDAAVSYAHRYVLNPNPAYYNFDKIGGDCTNFASQCLYAGFPQMNYAADGWYYRNLNSRSPSWTGVEFLRNFLVRGKATPGPRATEVALNGPEDLAPLRAGDLIQLSFDGAGYGHTLVVVETGGKDGILIATRSYARDYYPLLNYTFVKARGLLII